MKTRNLFVSNSSSSSFILLGFELPTDFSMVNAAKKMFADLSEEDHYNIDEKVSEYFRSKFGRYGRKISDENLYGIIVATAIEEESVRSVDIDELSKIVENIKTELDIVSPIKLYFGSESC